MRRVLLLVLALGVAGCAAEIGHSSGEPDNNGNGGPPSSGSGGSAGGGNKPGNDPPPSSEPGADAGAASDAGAMAGGFCAQLIPVSASSFQDLPAAPGSKLRVRVRASDPSAPPVTWTWTVTFGDGSGAEVPTTAVDPQATEVELPLEKPGHYQIVASAEIRTNPCSVSTIAFATAADRRLGHFRVRITPPPGLIPAQDVPIQAMAGVPLVQPLAVQQGQVVTFQPRDDRGGIASYVRVNQLGSSLAIEGHTAHADFKPPLLAVYNYDVLFVPDDDVIAPFVALGLTPAALNVLPQKLTPGSELVGTLRDATGGPLKDGRVILRAGPLTSTVGKSEATGDYKLHVRGGQFAVTASPDPATGLPELSLPADAGITIDAAVAAAGTLELKWAAIVPAPVSLVVRASDGAAPAAGARVRLERATPMMGAGTFVYTPPGGTAVTRPMPGTVRLNGQVGADGTIAFPRVPPGSYRLLVTPADTDRTSALTATTLEVPAGGVSAQNVRLAGKVKLRGKLLPSPASADTRVYAAPRDLDPPRPVASAIVGADGSYQLDVDPQRGYVVWADPGLGKPFARAQLATVDAGAAGTTVPDRNLPKALAWKSTLFSEAGPINGAVIQIFCDLAAASCLDPNITLGEGLSDKSGGFTLSLPDPGSF
jgi:hypothetical protein